MIGRTSEWSLLPAKKTKHYVSKREKRELRGSVYVALGRNFEEKRSRQRKISVLDELFRRLTSKQGLVESRLLLPKRSDFSSRVRAMAASSSDSAIDEIYEFCLDRMATNAFDDIDRLMEHFDIAGLPAEVMLAPLAITVPVTDRLKNRRRYYDRVAGELTRMARTDAAELLAGLQ